jgi:2-isopropylmalate synthase
MSRIFLYDTTLRDGGQTSFVDFSLDNKFDLSKKISELGVDFIEAGWPGANPTDTEYFAKMPKLSKSEIVAFGMTSKSLANIESDQGFMNLVKSKAKIVTIVGKSWDFQVKEALKISLDENLKIIEASIKRLKKAKKRVFFDAEHFFDGYKENPDYALKVLEVAEKAGSEWLVLCDTNGGSMTREISSTISDVCKKFSGDKIAIHCHNDCGLAVANSLAAIEAGARQIQGTINGLGERCGNANLTAIIPTLKLKLGYQIGVSDKQLKNLKTTSNYLQDCLNKPYDPYAAYVGYAAFAHKGGLHISAMVKNSKSYEHINPQLVGNDRQILISNQAGKSALKNKLTKLEYKFGPEDLSKLIKIIKAKEKQGYAYDMADASFKLLCDEYFSKKKDFFELDNYRVINEKRINAKGKMITVSEAVINLVIKGKSYSEVASGNGPVSALDGAFRKLLDGFYPKLKKCRLSDYKVRILDSSQATDATIRVMIETMDDKGNRWVSIGVATDLIDASFTALSDAINFFLAR